MIARSVPTVAVLGASGLIGEAVARRLMRDGFQVVPMARRFTPAQRARFGHAAVEVPFVAAGADVLGHIFDQTGIDIVLNCVGVLQDGPKGSTELVHHDFVGRLVHLLASRSVQTLLVHLSIPGSSGEDRTSFSQTKRAAERAIAAELVPFVILRPGFVVAEAAYGGSAMIRALAMLPCGLPTQDAARPFVVTDVADIARTVAIVARRWGKGDRQWAASWDVMARSQSTIGEVIEGFRRQLGGPAGSMCLPSWLLTLGARAGDVVAHLGWSSSMRSTALQEIRRGVSGDPAPWIAETGIEPADLGAILDRLPSTVQERWFARLYLCKPLIFVSLAMFWVISGLIALALAFDTATAILTSHGFSRAAAAAITVISSAADIAIGVAIAFRWTSRLGLLTGIAVSLGYMAAAAVLAPDMWIEPMGALVKTGPAIVLMVVALGMLNDR